MNKIIIPDSNVFIKLLIPEKDSKQAFQLCEAAVKNSVDFLVPELFRYEVIQVVYGKKCEIGKILELIEAYEESSLTCKNPTITEWKKSTEIIESGHPKSGSPSMYDSIYHALAIENDGVFITADRRHFEKSKSFGHIAMLSDWQKTIDQILHSKNNFE